MARATNGSVSAYAAYESEHSVKGIGTFVPRDLYDLMSRARPNTADGAIIKEALVMLVNSTPGITSDGYELPGRAKKESAKDKAEREARETAKKLTDALAEIAALKAQLVPTPPAVKANAKGQLVTQ